MNNKNYNELIVDTLHGKAQLKQKVYDQTASVFDELKDVLQNKVTEINGRLENADNRVFLNYTDRGSFETEVKVAGDLIIFNMHTNIFQFDKSHGIWKMSYIKDNPDAAYCGIINIYNFLSDSFKYSRMNDLGYCIGRIFINKDGYFFVEGKRQLGFLYNNFGTEVLNAENLSRILESAILYTLDFDLLVPPYENIAVATVGQMHEKFEQSKIQTGKRLGFKFYSEEEKID